MKIEAVTVFLASAGGVYVNAVRVTPPGGAPATISAADTRAAIESLRSSVAMVEAGGSFDPKSGLLPGGLLDPRFRARAAQVATSTGIPLSWLLAVMWLESAETMRSDVMGSAGTVGLLQSTQNTAAALGTTLDALAGMSAVRQLDYVEAYYRRFGSFAKRDGRDAYVALVWPANIGKSNALGVDQRNAIEQAHAAITAKGWAAGALRIEPTKLATLGVSVDVIRVGFPTGSVVNLSVAEAKAAAMQLESALATVLARNAASGVRAGGEPRTQRYR